MRGKGRGAKNKILHINFRPLREISVLPSRPTNPFPALVSRVGASSLGAVSNLCVFLAFSHGTTNMCFTQATMGGYIGPPLKTRFWEVPGHPPYVGAEIWKKVRKSPRRMAQRGGRICALFSRFRRPRRVGARVLPRIVFLEGGLYNPP